MPESSAETSTGPKAAPPRSASTGTGTDCSKLSVLTPSVIVEWKSIQCAPSPRPSSNASPGTKSCVQITEPMSSFKSVATFDPAGIVVPPSEMSAFSVPLPLNDAGE